ncbi:hypothetical protein C5167_040127 [Papaver somniferum]|uniref:Glycosyltransferase 2-like domain-containing protein n=1 Tax=Papaver somniferum TaxID=3469 RepID=A0A4Y7IGK5_PAPSO|nr:hypothetical protein C5167_040127 [Papaver somniferum]
MDENAPNRNNKRARNIPPITDGNGPSLKSNTLGTHAGILNNDLTLRFTQEDLIEGMETYEAENDAAITREPSHMNQVPSAALTGGLILLWKHGFVMDIVHSSEKMIHALVTHDPSKGEWFLSCIYVIGDLNITMNPSERNSLSTNHTSADVLDRIRDSDLYDMGFQGNPFTWTSNSHGTGWHFRPPSIDSALSFEKLVYAKWLLIRADYLAPPLQFRRLKPVPLMEFNDGEGGGDVEDQNSEDYPMVLIQIPMCNEKEVYHQSIAAVCIQDWPADRMLVQVLDDSDELDVQHLIKAEVQKWQQKGVHIIYRHRLIRTGYKAGNLKSAMSCDYVKDYEFVAIFDADFQPGPDFLKKTIPHFKGNEDLALVQTRWSFVNKDENLLTRLQNINLSFHFEVEQQVNGIFINFFGFNGTAGVWRIKALEESGGWLERTTVEDMDIAVRAHLCGWKFIYLNDVKCLCELPESYGAYIKQQHRWHSGPMQLFRLCFVDILRSKDLGEFIKGRDYCFHSICVGHLVNLYMNYEVFNLFILLLQISVAKKANLIFLFFLLRKLILPFYSFTLFCIILPLTMFLPEAHLPAWVVCYVPGVMSILNIIPAPRSVPFIVPYLLFENTMSVTKFNAMISGLFRLTSSYEWVVTKKLGRSSEADLIAFEKESETQAETTSLIYKSSSESGLADLTKLEITKKSKKKNRLYKKELALAFILLAASARSLLSAQGIHFYFLLFQGITFLVVGLDLIGEQVS